MKLSLSDFDHPVVFLFFMTLAIIPVMVLVFMGASKLGLLSSAN